VQVAGGNTKWYSSLESLGLQAAQGLKHLAKTKPQRFGVWKDR